MAEVYLPLSPPYLVCISLPMQAKPSHLFLLHPLAGPSLAQFTKEHNAWFNQVRKITSRPGGGEGSAGEGGGGAGGGGGGGGDESSGGVKLPAVPTLRVYTEDLIDGGASFEAAMRGAYDFLGLPKVEGPIRLPARVTAPEKKQVGKRVSKSKVYKQRREAEMSRRKAMAVAGG